MRKDLIDTVPKCSDCSTVLILKDLLELTCKCGKITYSTDGKGKSWIFARMSGSYTFVKPKKEKERDEYFKD